MSFDEPNANQIIEHDVCPRACRALWCAVLHEQLSLAVKPSGSDRLHEIDAARRWFGPRDFFITCALAGFDGDYVMAGVRRKFELDGVA